MIKISIFIRAPNKIYNLVQVDSFIHKHIYSPTFHYKNTLVILQTVAIKIYNFGGAWLIL